MAYQVLVVEDNEADQGLIKFFFEKCPIKTQLHFAHDGVEASDFLLGRKAQGKRPKLDLVLMDLNMPRKDGRALVKEMKANRDLCRIPVVMLSTSTSANDIADCYCHGASAFISKPTDLTKFEKTIQCMVNFFFEYSSLPSRPH